MTLILVVPASDGIVMGSDGQITFGAVRSTGQKIYHLNDRCLWAASGELSLIQRVEERMKSLPSNAPLLQLRDGISQIVRQCATELLQLDFRTNFLPQDPNLLLRLHPGDFVFAEMSPQRAILHVLVYGTPEWITNRPFATGSGDMFAYALLQKYQGVTMNLKQASLLAYKVLDEAIAVGAYGLGYPIDIWHITMNGIRQLSSEEMAALADSAREVREMEVRLITGSSIG
jgi:proteasome beta subunit